MYVYIRSEPGLFTVGFYAPDNQWHPDSDWNTQIEAANQVAFLNGQNSNHLRKMEERIFHLEEKIKNLEPVIEGIYFRQ
jgi:hypothetical protein